MRTVLLLLAVVALAVGGWLVYQRFLAPDARACEHVASRCGLASGDVASCKKVVAEVRKAGGDDAAGRLTDCLAGAGSCTEAAGCLTGIGTAVFSRSVLEFVDGLRRSQR